VHPFGAFFIGGIGALIFVFGYRFETEVLKIDDVLGVWPLHGVAGSWGGIAAGIFGSTALGGVGGVSFMAQVSGTFAAIAYASVVGSVVYVALKYTVGIRLSKEEELRGSDISIHRISAYPEQEFGTGSPAIFEPKSAVQSYAHAPVNSEPVTE
jgi:Amt family ammonium transporter